MGAESVNPDTFGEFRRTATIFFEKVAEYSPHQHENVKGTKAWHAQGRGVISLANCLFVKIMARSIDLANEMGVGNQNIVEEESKRLLKMWQQAIEFAKEWCLNLRPLAEAFEIHEYSEDILAALESIEEAIESIINHLHPEDE